MINLLIVMTGGIRSDGISLSQLELIKRIDKIRYNVDILAVHNNDINIINKFKENGCNVIEMPDRQKKVLKYVKLLRKYLKTRRYDIIHVQGSSSLMYLELGLAKKYHIPLRIAHSHNTLCDHVFINKILYPLFMSSHNLSLACGKEAGEWLFHDNNFNIIHNGKNLKDYAYNDGLRKKIRKKYNLNNKIVFGHVGSFTKQKNHAFLIDIFYSIHQIIPNSVLYLIGDGLLKHDIISKVSDLKISDDVVFLGTVDNVAEIIQGFDMMLFPSLFEGLPNVVIEWQASGLPCLISDKITDECKVSKHVVKVPIDHGTDVWIDYIKKVDWNNYDRKKVSDENCNLLKKNGFDINENIKILENYYETFLNCSVQRKD